MDGPDIFTVPSIAVSFPLPFHIFVLVGLGILGWATNLHGLDIAGIDVIGAMDLRTDGGNPLPAHHSPVKHSSNLSVHYRALYQICMVYSLLGFVSWAAYRHATHGDLVLMDTFGYIPGITALLALSILLCPYNVLHKTERRKFLHAVGRCLFSSSDSPVYFSDVVLADILTSFSQVLGDVWLSLWMLIPGNSILIPPAESGLLRWILPIIMSLPYLIRLRQCIVEYGHQGNPRSLYNALKYATAFPVIYLSAAQHIVAEELVKKKGPKALETSWHGEHRLFRLWLLAATVNSLYSFWWDVANDWGLNLLKSHTAEDSQKRPSPPKRLVLPHLYNPVFSVPVCLDDTSSEMSRLPTNLFVHHLFRSKLRPTLHFPSPVYLAVMLLNFVLRLTWLMRPFGLVEVQSHAGLANFCLQMGELIRRWIWVFIRVEWEMIKKSQGHTIPPINGNEPEYEMIASAAIE